MTLNEYQDFSRGFRLKSADKQYVLLNIGGEVGELLSLYAKGRRDGKLDENLIAKELGDILWHIGAIADDHGWTLDYIAAVNILKLQSRKNDGTIQGSGDER